MFLPPQIDRCTLSLLNSRSIQQNLQFTSTKYTHLLVLASMALLIIAAGLWLCTGVEGCDGPAPSSPAAPASAISLSGCASTFFSSGGPHSSDSWLRRPPMAGGRYVSKDCENQPRIGCQLLRLPFLVTTYCWHESRKRVTTSCGRFIEHSRAWNFNLVLKKYF